MSHTLFGLASAEAYRNAGQTFDSHRREIIRSFPSGNVPLTTILSFTGSEPIGSTVHNWHEDYWDNPFMRSRGTDPLTDTAPSDGDDDGGDNHVTGTILTTAALFLKVDTTKDAYTGQIIELQNTTGIVNQFRVIEVVNGVADPELKGYLQINPQQDYTSLAGDDNLSGTSGANAYVRPIGSAFGEGARGRSVGETSKRIPVNPFNVTQIFRDKFSFPGTVLRIGAKWDDTGPYKYEAKNTSLRHMLGLERAILLSRRSTVFRQSLDSSTTRLEPVRQMSGIRQFLELWDSGRTGLLIDGSTFAPYSHKGQSILDTDPEKRIINNVDGQVGPARFDDWMERLGRNTDGMPTENRLMLMGGGTAKVFSEMFRKSGVQNLEPGDGTFGLPFNKILTTFGDVVAATHPILSSDPAYTNSAIILNMNNLRLRPVNGRDTQLLTNRQNNGDDERVDEWLTEVTLEFKNAPSALWIENITTFNQGA